MEGKYTTKMNEYKQPLFGCRFATQITKNGMNVRTYSSLIKLSVCSAA